MQHATCNMQANGFEHSLGPIASPAISPVRSEDLNEREFSDFDDSGTGRGGEAYNLCCLYFNILVAAAARP